MKQARVWFSQKPNKNQEKTEGGVSLGKRIFQYSLLFGSPVEENSWVVLQPHNFNNTTVIATATSSTTTTTTTTTTIDVERSRRGWRIFIPNWAWSKSHQSPPTESKHDGRREKGWDWGWEWGRESGEQMGIYMCECGCGGSSMPACTVMRTNACFSLPSFSNLLFWY